MLELILTTEPLLGTTSPVNNFRRIKKCKILWQTIYFFIYWWLAFSEGKTAAVFKKCHFCACVFQCIWPEYSNSRTSTSCKTIFSGMGGKRQYIEENSRWLWKVCVQCNCVARNPSTDDMCILITEKLVMAVFFTYSSPENQSFFCVKTIIYSEWRHAILKSKNFENENVCQDEFFVI